MRIRVLTQENIERAKQLKDSGATKRELAEIFGVGQSTIWDNVFRRVRIESTILEQCSVCEIRLKQEVTIEDGIKKLPFNYKLGDKCLHCVLQLKGLDWKDLKDFGIKIYT